MKTLLVLLAACAVLTLSCGCTRTPFKDFDVGADTFDPNPFPLNPKWGKQIEQNTIPNPSESCPLDSGSTNQNDWTNNPQFPNCTSYAVSFNDAHLCGPHVNFMPVTYQGTVRWDSHQTFWPFGDDDYTLNVFRDDQALYTAQDHQVHIEFDSDETVDNWDDTNTWWDNFHHNAVDQDDAHARAMIDGRSVIVIGLLNLDKEHRGKPELHPVYAMFVRVNSGNTPSLRQSSWAFFVRNWGNEGYCGSDDEGLYAARQQVSIKVPDVINIKDNNIWEGAQNEDQLSGMEVTGQHAGDGIILTFTLLTPDKQSWFVGDITFETREPANTEGGNASAGVGSPATEPSPSHTEGEDKIPDDLAERYNKLPDNAKLDLIAQLRSLTPKRKSFKVQRILLDEQSNIKEIHHKLPVKVAVDSGLVRAVKNSRTQQIRQKRRELAEKFLSQHSDSP